MAISRARDIFNNGFKNALSLGGASTVDRVTGVEALSALVEGVPLGKIRKGTSMVPLVPSGATSTRGLLSNAMSLGSSATPSRVARLCALAVTSLCPEVPSIGRSVLEKNLETAWSLGDAAELEKVSKMMAGAVVEYYQAGTVI